MWSSSFVMPDYSGRSAKIPAAVSAFSPVPLTMARIPCLTASKFAGEIDTLFITLGLYC